MNAYLPASVSDLWSIAGWTMVHFLWLGALVAVAAAVCRLALRRASANVRYACLLAWLIVLVALPIATAAWLTRHSPPLKGGAGGGMVAATAASMTAVPLPSESNPTRPVIELHNRADQSSAPGSAGGFPTAEIALPEDPRQSRGLTGVVPPAMFVMAFDRLEVCIPYLPLLWLVGTPVTFLLLLTGVVGARRLGGASQPVSAGPVAEILARLVDSLHITHRVTVAICERIASPVLIGILRPMILLPPAALTGWSPDEIEMVLLHELAHVRRWDNLINLLQRFVESLLFFHPAVWLISNWVRREREACCDAVVVGRTNRPHAYAEMLVALAAQMPRSVLFHPAASSAMAAGPLRSRIRRILQVEDDPMLVSGKSLAIAVGSLLVAGTLAVLYMPTIGHAEQAAAEGTELKVSQQPPNAETVQASTTTGTAAEETTAAPVAPQSSAKKTGIDLPEVPPLEPAAPQSPAATTSTDSPAPAEANPTTENRVFAEFPQSALSQTPQLVFSAVEAAKKKNLHLDMEDRGDMVALIVKPVPTEADWPAILGDPPRKERVIADKAWQRLGLKLAPLNRLESLHQQMTTGLLGLQIVGGNVPRGLPLPAILTSVNGHQVNDFDQLLLWLESEHGRSSAAMKCYATVNSNQYLFDAGPPASPSIDEVTTRIASRIAAGPNRAKSHFPTLEDQKLADLAWKRLGLELEPIGDDELKRVQALGYDGAVKITASNQSFNPGDLLVGLHVWPTTSIKDVAGVLTRDDLADLTPLKYYVVRQELASTREHPNGLPKDFVRSGRISVQSEGGSRGRWGGERNSAPPSPTRPTTNPPSTTSSSAPRRTPDPWSPGSYSVPPAATPAATFTESAPAGAATTPTPRPILTDLPPASNERSVLAEPNPRMLPTPANVPRMDVNASPPALLNPSSRQASDHLSPPVSPVNKSNLRYDGKTFGTWRDTWKTELSTEKRLEAIKALGAFGRAGYGKEAVEAILDVAAEYDFHTVDKSSEGKLKETVIDELAPESRRSLAEYWVPELAARLEKDPTKWTPLAIFVFSRLRTDDRGAIETLQSMAQSGPEDVRNSALTALIRSAQSRRNDAQLDEKTKKLVDDALASKDPATVAAVLQLLVNQSPVPRGRNTSAWKVIYRPAMFDTLLFHKSESVRQQARNMLSHLDAKDGAQIAQDMLAVLGDPSLSKDYVETIRALGALGLRGEAAVGLLENLLFDKSQELAVRVAAGFAIDRIEGGTRGQNIIASRLEVPADEKSQTRLHRLIQLEQQQ